MEIALIVVTGLSIARALYEYWRQNKLKRKDNFFKLRKELSEHFFPILQNFEEHKLERDQLERIGSGKDALNDLTKKYDEQLASISYHLRFKLLDHLEEIALMLNSKFIDDKMVKYMYGWVVEQVWERDGFWIYYKKEADRTDRIVSLAAIKENDWMLVKALYHRLNAVETKRRQLKF